MSIKKKLDSQCVNKNINYVKITSYFPKILNKIDFSKKKYYFLILTNQDFFFTRENCKILFNINFELKLNDKHDSNNYLINKKICKTISDIEKKKNF